jgi:hypothetical protein
VLRLTSILIAISLITGACRGAPRSMPGTFADLERQVDRLLRATDPHAFLVIELQGTPHFLQFSASSEGIELDYPLVTEEQKKREGALRTVCSGAGLRLRESTGSDGTRFLDCDLPRDAKVAAAAVRRALELMFGASPDTQLLFGGDRLPAVAA